MRAFSIDDLKRGARSIEDAARREPVSILDADEEFVLMTRRAYDALTEATAVVAATPERLAYRVDELPDDLRDELLAGLERVADAPYRTD